MVLVRPVAIHWMVTGTTVIFIILLIVNRQKASKHFQMLLNILAALAVATMVEFMVLSFGGHQSSYYAGMIIVFMFCL